MFESLARPYEKVEPFCIRFVNTVGNRLAEQPSEYLTSPERLGEWMTRVGFSDPGDIEVEAFERALQLRSAAFTCLTNPSGESWESLNRELGLAFAHLSLIDGRWGIDPPNEVERALNLVALSAASLLSSPLREHVKMCGDSCCGWLFLDRSKNHSRRWCSMSDCGNLAKARRFQEKRRRNTVA